MATTNRIRKSAAVGVGLFIVLLLACGGQTRNSSHNNQRPEQKKASGVKHIGQTGISQPQDQRQPYVLDEVLVKFKPGADRDAIERTRADLNLEIIREFSSPNLFLMKITDGSSVETVIEQLKTYEAVKYAEPNYAVKTAQ
jgi:hypothetical protein